MDNETDPRLRFGNELYTPGALRQLATDLFALAGNANQYTSAELRTVEDSFPGDAWINIYSLWHWCGGPMASAGDLRMVDYWLRSPAMSEIITAMLPDYRAHTKACQTVRSLVYDAMETGGDFTAAALAMAEILDGLVADAAPFVGYDETTDEWEDHNGILWAVDLLLVIADCFRAGEEDGRYLPDEAVYAGLAGQAPLPE